MEPITAAASFANIVGLMADFAGSRGHRDVLEIKEFLEWLRFHGFEELRGKIESNANVSASVKAAFAEGKQELLDKLTSIEQLLAALTVGQGSLHELALAVNPMVGLSQQGKDILAAFEAAGAGQALLHESFEDETLLMIGGAKSVSFSPTEQRFFQSDLSELVSLKLLELARTAKGTRTFLLTRRGSAVAKAVLVAKERSAT